MMVPVQPYKAPPTVTWEVTRLGGLGCRPWRIEETKTPDPEQLSTDESKNLIDQLENMDTKRLVLAGGDPFERQDLLELIKYVKKTDLKLTLQPTATDNLSSENIRKVAEEKFLRFNLYLDAPYPELHDKFWNQKNVFQKTIEMAYKIRRNELPLQINTIITAQSAPLLADLFLKVSSLNPVSWKIYFLVPTGQDGPVQPPGFHVTKIIFEEIYSLEKEVDFEIIPVEAPYYNRFWLESKTEELDINLQRYTSTGKPLAVSEIIDFMPEDEKPDPERFYRQPGRENIFINCRGDVFPDRFLPLKCGNIREKKVKEIFQNSPLLKKIRDPLELGGCCKKTNCWAREICGGSRARGYTYSGEPMKTDPLCYYNALKSINP